MPLFQVQGTTFDGQTIDTSIHADSQKSVLTAILYIYKSRLKKPFEIYISSQLDPDYTMCDFIPPLRRDQPLSDDDVIRIAALIKGNGQVEPDEYHRFEIYFRDIIRPIVSKRWNDITISTKEDVELEMLHFVIMEFMPKYSHSRGSLRSFIWKKIDSRLVKNWRREKYINADKKETAVSKSKLLGDFIRTKPTLQRFGVEITERDKIIKRAIQLIPILDKLTIPYRREFFEWVVREGLHKEFISYKKQVEVMDLVYGSDMKEIDAASERRISQPTLNRTKNRAEVNFFKYIKYNFTKK